ncbi:penicillin-binding protein 2 [Candidatus Nomurabacteria bacterium]|nr:penicillin-binding protein 2 [Candidatus Nomurabacteria bacterium]USN95024.1 MAG: penicillin-binding protein 2 [Candidatus Nomurabacteria bacterium]
MSFLKNNLKNTHISRIRFLSIGLMALSLLVIVKLFTIQVLNVDEYRKEAEEKYVSQKSPTFKRGDIYMEDKDGGLIALATTKSGYKLQIVPNQIEDVDGTLEALKQYIDIDEEKYNSTIEKADGKFYEVHHEIDKDEGVSISELELPGVYISAQNWRFYPGDNIAAQTVGFVGFEGDKLSGRYGLERYYNEELDGGEGSVAINPFAEVFLNVRNIITGKSGYANLITTIDPNVEIYLRNTLLDLTERWNTTSAGALILDPVTGEIIAISFVPSFDPNEYEKVNTISSFINPFTSNIYEFGSVIKPLVMAGALNSKVVTRDTSYYDGGSVVVEDKTIYNFDKKGRGTATMQDVLNQSLNTGMVFVADKLGKDRVRDYLLGYGIDEPTGVDLPSEISGKVSNLYSPRQLEYATASFGQGIAITPFEAVRAFSALANDGELPNLHIGKKLIYEGKEKELKWDKQERSNINPETSEEITRMLVEVLDSMNSGSYKIPTHSVAGKTGTAQIPDPVNGGYYESRYLHSIFGYFPAYDPEYLVFYFIKEPIGARYSSQTLGESFFDTVKFLINYYDIPPDR